MTITRAQYRRLLALKAKAESTWVRFDALMKEAREITGEADEWGHTNDCFFAQATNVDTMLGCLQIEVEPKKKAGRPRKVEASG